ncbi:MAG: low-specificity L-threonine aldolase [Nitrospinales bacterium]
MKPIDLRSDTVTQPTDTMRTAMAQAEVGDDVLEEDPSIHRLQNAAARKTGKEEALFVASGTMGNLVGVLTHCGRGDEIILGDRSHIFLNEVGGIAALGGVHPRTLGNREDGTLPLAALENAVRHDDLHYPPTRLICLENTHNFCSGAALSPQYMEDVARFAKQHALKVHLDGARIFNAAAALAVDVAELTRHADSVMFCLSKGLSAPVGSLICGSREFIGRARKIRKMVGGGMRQAGHLAAAGIVALDQLVDRLKQDHDHAKKLAHGLAAIAGIELALDRVQTNIVFFSLNHPRVTPETFLRELETRQVKLFMTGPAIFRAVLHREVSEEQVDCVLDAVGAILNS